MSVFISWAGADREVKNVIAEKLREENINYFDSDEHCLSNFSEECIRNIRKSLVFIVIDSDASLDAHSYVRNEIIEARRMENDGNLNILVYKITDSPYNEFFSFNLNHISDANHVARIQRTGGGGIETLIKRVKHLLALREAGTPEKPHDVLYPRVVGTPISTASYLGYFVENSRDGLIDELRGAFSQSNTVILSELFGFGKKSVIKKYVGSANYKAAIEIEGMHDSLFEFFFGDLRFSNVNDDAFNSGDARAAIRRKFELLSHLDEKHILIISDVDIESEPDEEIIKLLRGLRCHVAIITQNSAEAYSDYMPVLSVGRMKSEHLAELFFHYYDRSGSIDREALMPTLEDFFDGIGGHTKTVEIAASVLAKELCTDIEEVKSFLSTSGDGRTLVDRIVGRLATLIDLEGFDDNESKTLLIISLLAAPVINFDTLFEISEAAGINARLALKPLSERRWLSINSKTESVYIEPIIARICAAKLTKDYATLTVCFKHIVKSCIAVSLRDLSSLSKFTQMTKHFLRAVELPEVAELVRALKPTEFKDSDVIDSLIDNFLGWFADMRESFDGENEGDVFKMNIAAWAISYIAPALESYQKMPLLFSFNTNITLNINDIIHSKIAELITLQYDPIIAGYCEELVSEYEETENDIFAIQTKFIESFNTKDYVMMQEALDELLDSLCDPSVLSDDDSATITITLAKVFANFCINSGAYRTGINFLEKLLCVDFKPCFSHSFIMIYLSLIVASGDCSVSISEILDTAESMLEDATVDGSLKGDALTDAKRNHLAYAIYGLTEEGEYDMAAEKLDELCDIGSDEVLLLIATSMNSIVDAWLANGEKEKATEFISKNVRIFTEVINSDNASDRIRENATSTLSLLEVLTSDEAESITTGGVVENQSYYQKYSRDKKNGLFKMMAYNKVADAAKKFDFSGIKNSEFKAHVERLRERARTGEPKLKLAPEAFALVSEAGFRTLGYRHHYVQHVGAAAMLDGKIAEILNGEGKTYTIPLVAFVNSLYHDMVFVIDESYYLTERNYKWMRGLYSLLGISTAHIKPQNQWEFPIDKNKATVYYTSLASLAFAIMHRDLTTPEKRDDFKTCAVIVDEADSLLVERANLPLSITENKSSPEYRELCIKAYELAERIADDETYYSFKNGYPVLTGECSTIIEEAFGINYSEVNRTETILKIETLLKIAISSSRLERGKDYFIFGNTVKEENKSTGELILAEGEKAYFIARREGLKLSVYEENLTKNRMTRNKIYLYGLLKRFGTISGTSATASSFKKEFKDLYELEVLAIPPVLPVLRQDRTVTLFLVPERKDEEICRLVYEKHLTGQPVLLVTSCVRESQRYSALLDSNGIPHKLLNAVNSESSPEMLASAGMYGSVLVATQLANRGVDIKLGGDPERMTLIELCEAGYDLSKIDEILYTIPTDDMLESELYRKYTAILEKNRASARLNREAVLEAGGLCVISTEPSRNLRIEQQTRGRAGRQGAVGESYVFECIEDEFFKYILNEKTKAFVLSIGRGVDIIQSRLIERSVDKAHVNLHHVAFERMKSAARLSSRLEASKDAIYENMRPEYSLESICNLIGIWANSYNVQVAAENDIEANSKTKHSAGGVVLYSYEENGSTSDDYELVERLYYAAADYVQRLGIDGKNPSLFKYMTHALKLHLTATDELEEYYNWNATVFSDKFLEEQYSDNCLECIASGVEAWLMETIKAKGILHPKGSRRAAPNDLCPCGSGFKYKKCCGAVDGNKRGE